MGIVDHTVSHVHTRSKRDGFLHSSVNPSAMDIDVGLVAQRYNERARALARRLADHLEGRGVAVVVDEEAADATDRDGRPVSVMGDCDLVVSIGGDGTFLYVAREASEAPILGVNLGEVGFLNAVSPADAVDAVTAAVSELIETGSVTGREVDRLRAAGDDWVLELALNEVVLHAPRRGHGGGASFHVRVDGNEYVETHADGVFVATPTGSTAYNLSEGGPLVHPTVDALVITWMCPAEPTTPLVVGSESEVTVSIDDAESGYVISDGRDRRVLDPPETVQIATADDPVTIAGPRDTFFQALDKLE